MPSINLIASRREEKRRFEQYTRRLIYAVATEVGVILLVTSVLVLHLMTVRGHITQLDGQIQQLQPKVNEIQTLEANTALLKPKVNTLNEARNNTLYWYTALQTVVACLPQQAWLTSINTSGDPTPPKSAPAGSTPTPGQAVAGPGLSFNGMAANSDEVGLAMMRMNQYTNINSVTLGTVTQSQQTGQKAMTFTMTVQLKPNTAQDVTTPGFDVPATATPASPQPATVRQANVSVSVGAAKGVNHV